MTKGQLENAKRRALNILDKWIEVTGIITIDSGYHYELQKCIEDAVECGAQAACGVKEILESER